MIPDSFYINNHMTASLEYSLQTCDTYEDFEKNFSTEFLDEDGRVGMYLENLLYKYDRKASVVSFDAHLNPSYVGNIINFKKNNPRTTVSPQVHRPRPTVRAQEEGCDHLVRDHERGKPGNS